MEGKFFRMLRLAGLGFKARTESEGRLLYLKIGYNHEVEVTVPPAVRVFCFKPNAMQKERKVAIPSSKRLREIPKVEQIICIIGIDKQRVHKFVGDVRSLKPPEIFTGKGIYHMDEVISLRPMYKKMDRQVMTDWVCSFVCQF